MFWGRRSKKTNNQAEENLVPKVPKSGEITVEEANSFYERLEDHARSQWGPTWGLTEAEIESVLLVRKWMKDFDLRPSLNERAPALKREVAAKELELQSRRSDREAERQRQSELEAELEDERLKRLYPSREHSTVWLSVRVRPERQPFGISWRGAEELAAAWLTFLGEENVRVTQPSADGGVDVLTDEICCQVKLYASKPVTVNEVRELYGVSTSYGLRPLMFTSTMPTKEGIAFCLANDIMVLLFDAEQGTLDAVTPGAQALLLHGKY